MNEHEKHIQSCFQLAQAAVLAGNHPFGALLVSEGREIMRAENTVLTDHDVTRHAEFNLVSAASRQLKPEQLKHCTIYTSTEPCAMCSGAIYWAGIGRVVYGCSAQKLGEIAGASFVVPCTQIFAYGTEGIEVIGPVLEQNGANIHSDFW